jgi:hypothetical protein
MSSAQPPEIDLDIPEPTTLRNRLAVVLTEAGLLRAQLRVSMRLQKEKERLRQQMNLQGGRPCDL